MSKNRIKKSAPNPQSRCLIHVLINQHIGTNSILIKKSKRVVNIPAVCYRAYRVSLMALKCSLSATNDMTKLLIVLINPRKRCGVAKM